MVHVIGFIELPVAFVESLERIEIPRPKFIGHFGNLIDSYLLGLPELFRVLPDPLFEFQLT